ncbi:MAG: oligosaccharide flippase family protein [Nitrospirae bacterium]|nr:oligosaccharide flippase family protein [Candidatus Manganitrophaceae bacterium]
MQSISEQKRIESNGQAPLPTTENGVSQAKGEKSASISKQALTLIFGRGLSSAFTFLIPIILARYLNPTEYGTYKQIFLVYSSLFMILPFGIIQSLYYFIPKEPERMKTYLIQAFLFLQFSGLVALLFVAFFGKTIAGYFNNPELAPYLFQMGIFIFLMLSSAYFEALLISSQKIVQASALGFLSEAAKTACMLLPLIWSHRLTDLMWGMNAFAFVRFCGVLVYVIRGYSLRWRDVHWSTLRKQLAYSVPFGFAVILQATQDKFHQYVVAYSYSAAVFAVYSVGMFQLPLVELIYTPMSQLMIVRMSSLRQRATREEIISLWFDITKKLAMVFFPAFVFLQVVAHDLIVLLFTPTYLSSVPLFRIALFSLLTAIFLTEGVLRAYADTTFILKITFMKLVLTLLFIFPLLSWFGLSGGVLTLTLVLVIAKVTMLWKVARLIPLSLSALLPWRDLLSIGIFSVFCAVPVFFMGRIGTASPAWMVLLSATVYTVFYLVFLFGSHLITFDEKREIARMVRRVGALLPALSKS